MAKVKLNTDLSGRGSIIIDGIDMSKLVSSVDVHTSVDHGSTVNIEIFLIDCDVAIDGEVKINAIPVSDEIGRGIYQKLKELYEQQPMD